MSHFNFHAKIDPNSVVLVSLAPDFLNWFSNKMLKKKFFLASAQKFLSLKISNIEKY